METFLTSVEVSTDAPLNAIKKVPRVISSYTIAKSSLPVVGHADLSSSLVQSKKQLHEIKQVEVKVSNRVKYLANEEDKMLGKIARMQRRLESRTHLFQERETEIERLEVAKADRLHQLE